MKMLRFVFLIFVTVFAIIFILKDLCFLMTSEKTTGTVTKVHEVFEDYDDHTSIRYMVSFVYEVDGESYTGANKTKKLAVEGEVVIVYYQKSDPAKAYTGAGLRYRFSGSIPMLSLMAIFLFAVKKRKLSLKDILSGEEELQ